MIGRDELSALQGSINLAEVVWQALHESREKYGADQRKPPGCEGAIPPWCRVIGNGERLRKMLSLFFLQAMEGIGSDGLLTIIAHVSKKKGEVRLSIVADPSRFVGPDRETMLMMDLPLAAPRGMLPLGAGHSS